MMSKSSFRCIHFQTWGLFPVQFPVPIHYYQFIPFLSAFFFFLTWISLLCCKTLHSWHLFPWPLLLNKHIVSFEDFQGTLLLKISEGNKITNASDLYCYINGTSTKGPPWSSCPWSAAPPLLGGPTTPTYSGPGRLALWSPCDGEKAIPTGESLTLSF